MEGKGVQEALKLPLEIQTDLITLVVMQSLCGLEVVEEDCLEEVVERMEEEEEEARPTCSA